MRMLRLHGIPIFKQLQIEEAIFRADKGNWCLWNVCTGSPKIVMGISGKPAKLLDVDAVARYTAHLDICDISQL